ncbi:unnamed protein product, partial [Musa banksii]
QTPGTPRVAHGWMGLRLYTGRRHSFASSHVTSTGTWCCVRDQVSGCLWACSCSFILESLVFPPLPLFSCAHKVFDELLVKLSFSRDFGTCPLLVLSI